jgi:thymidylate synthase (FAD)
MNIVPEWLKTKRINRFNGHRPSPNDVWDIGFGAPLTTSREWQDIRITNLLRDVAFNKHSMNDGHHVSPLDNGRVDVGADGIEVRLVQGVDEEQFKRVMSMATRATIGLDLHDKTMADLLGEDNRDWEEMLKGGLQTALETQVIVFAVSGVSRTCTHQLVRSRKASFHQQSQRAGYYGDQPDARMPESVWRNERARIAWLQAKAASDEAYRISCEEDISYQDARYVLLEGTSNYIRCEYSVREFMNVYAYRGCSMFPWEIVSVMRQMRELLVEAHPWLAPYVKISCQDRRCTSCAGTGKVGRRSLAEITDGADERLKCEECAGTGMLGSKCTFQGWENVEGQCEFPWAKEELRTFKPQHHKIERKAEPAEDDDPS